MEITVETSLHHVVVVPTPGIGHLIPLAEFAKRLVHHYPNFQVTFIVPDDGSPMKHQRQLLRSLPKSISSVFLPPITFDDLPDDVKIETKIALSLVRSLPSLKSSLKVLVESTRVVALVVDVFGIDAIDVFKEFNLNTYIFFSTTAMVLQWIFHLPKLDQMFSCEYRDMPEPIKLPGCVPFHGKDIAEPAQDKNNVSYQSIIRLAERYPMAAGIMVNSFVDLEEDTFKAFIMQQGDDQLGLPAVYPVGPLAQTGSIHGYDGSDFCLKWLDEQPNGSVIYVCFGSGGTFSQEQMNELALGLEMSGQRFLWVVKSPAEKAKDATYFGVESVEDPLQFLPDGFLERTKGLGLLVPSWAPQVEILRHGSTGGFLTHCGWNSTLEAITNGVPLIAWPLYAEQKMNAVLLADGLKVAMRVKEDDENNVGVVVGRQDIANYIKGLIEGEEGKVLRKEMRKLKDAADVVLRPDGSSTKSIANVAEIWMNHEQKIV